ncbi:MAG: hypothetical protein CMM58_08900 [Rhodospirillaceae bacterium]|nr:hypothetical protein [Rhodospirillaceae bacterium]|tara:strand:- start:998 stop:2062 length:1065 start_codon:yes stop_codon:yes gene_type:complete
MRFGWLTLSLSSSPDQDKSNIEQVLLQAQEAEKLGFQDVWLTEHYFTGESVYNDAILFAAALAMRTNSIRIGFSVVQMPFHHPIRLATQLALLDNLSNGRIDVGIGKGTVFNEYEFIGYGLRSDDSQERAREGYEILEKAWAGGGFKYEGKFYTLQVPEIRPRPVQRPGPPIWRSVISPESFVECGRLAIPILTARLPLESITDRWSLYKKGLKEGGHSPAIQNKLLRQNALWRNVYVAESDDQAENELMELLIETREHMMAIRRDLNPEDFVPRPETLNAWTDPNVGHEEGASMAMKTGSLYGSPETVKEQIAELENVGVSHLLCQTGFGAMDTEKHMNSIRTFGQQVMPNFM